MWAYGMPRLDYLRALHPALEFDELSGLDRDPGSAEDPAMRSYRSGFWGLVRITARSADSSLELALRVERGAGIAETPPLATIGTAEPVAVAPDGEFPGSPGPTVAICMATYNPPLDLFQRQVDSIRAQTHENWVCLISDDCSKPESVREIETVIGGDPRFIFSCSERRQGFYVNFERALGMVPGDAAYVTLADQDDFWYPEKLEALLDGIGEAQLIYSDARIVGRGGEEISPTYWGRRRRDHESLLALLTANCVTGAASLFRREVLTYALPFPPAQFAHYHDHWIGLVARMLGRIDFIDRPLYDYVQHGRSALGHSAATRTFSLRQRAGKILYDPHERVQLYRARYFRDVARLMVFATILEMRCGTRARGEDRRALNQYLALERSWPALARLGWRAARELVSQTETLGAEWSLLPALLWRRAVALTASRRPRRHLRLEAMPPIGLAPPAQRRTLGEPASRLVGQKIAPLELEVARSAPRRVNLLIPTIDLEHFFGGYITKLNLARRLSERGVRVRLVTVDHGAPLPRDWKRRVEAYSGLAGLFDQVEVEFGRAGPLEVSPGDSFIATTWWTAHVAGAACQALGQDGFVYLIQEYEPMTFPWGTMSSLASASYRYPHFALFSSELLREYFERHRIGVYEDGPAIGETCSASFQNAITPVSAPAREQLATRAPRRLLFYARPEPHAARNMFELGILGLAQALEEGAFRRGWELRGIGTVGSARRIDLGGDIELELIPRAAQRDYAGLLAEHDVGLALMYSPHPSLVPIEMASAGLRTVTNTFENKTADALKKISSNLIAGSPTVEGIAEALQEAEAGVGEFDRRLHGASVAWSRDWSQSFDDALLTALERYLTSLARAA